MVHGAVADQSLPGGAARCRSAALAGGGPRGASELRRLWTVALPVARRPILAATMLAFARALGDFGVTLMIAGDIPGYTQTAALSIYDSVQGRTRRAGTALGAVLSGIALSLLYLTNRRARRPPAGSSVAPPPL